MYHLHTELGIRVPAQCGTVSLPSEDQWVGMRDSVQIPVCSPQGVLPGFIIACFIPKDQKVVLRAAANPKLLLCTSSHPSPLPPHTHNIMMI